MRAHYRIPLPSRRVRGRAAGFTLMEMLVVIAILGVIIVAALSLLDSTSQMANRQISQVELQQSLRTAQNDMGRRIRGIGRGGLPYSTPDRALPSKGLGLTVLNNVADGTEIVNGSKILVLEKTDVVYVRGVFKTPVYQINSIDTNSFQLDEGAGTGTVIVPAETPVGRFDQPLKALIDADDDLLPEAILLVSASSPDMFGVAELDPGTTTFTAASGTDPAFMTVGFKFSGGTHTDEYAKISAGPPKAGQADPTFPATKLKNARVSHIGLLEEYRYYVREDYLTPGDASTLSPKLSRARVYPGTETAHENDTENLHVDLVDNVLDLQAALAFDSSNSGGADGDPVESLDGSADDWFLNSSSDTSVGGAPVAPFDTLLTSNNPRLFFVRLTTLARAQVPDRNHLAKEIDRIEDRDYTTDALNDIDQRHYVRSFLHTIVDMRNQ